MKSCTPLLLMLLFGCVHQTQAAPDVRSKETQNAGQSRTVATVDDARSVLIAWNRTNEPDSPLSRIEVLPYEQAAGTFVALYDWEPHWWGGACVLNLANTDSPTITVLEDLDEQSMFSIRVLRLRGFAKPLIEILGKTHMGNGSLYLYELDDGNPRLLLETCAVDFHQDWAVLKGGVLSPDYRDLNGDGTDDIVLSGTSLQAELIPETDSEGVRYYRQGSGWASETRVRKAFRFAPDVTQFVELPEWRIGPPQYMD